MSVGVGGEPALRITGLRKSFTTPAGNATVLDDSDLTIHGGKIDGVDGMGT